MENTKTLTETSTAKLLQIVLDDESNNGCSDRVKLQSINKVLLYREGKTSAQLLSEDGL
jgi:hypothetical protein